MALPCLTRLSVTASPTFALLQHHYPRGAYSNFPTIKTEVLNPKRVITEDVNMRISGCTVLHIDQRVRALADVY